MIGHQPQHTHFLHDIGQICGLRRENNLTRVCKELAWRKYQEFSGAIRHMCAFSALDPGSNKAE